MGQRIGDVPQQRECIGVPQRTDPVEARAERLALDERHDIVEEAVGTRPNR
jgi:hypothetical protein